MTALSNILLANKLPAAILAGVPLAAGVATLLFSSNRDIGRSAKAVVITVAAEVAIGLVAYTLIRAYGNRDGQVLAQTLRATSFSTKLVALPGAVLLVASTLWVACNGCKSGKNRPTESLIQNVQIGTAITLAAVILVAGYSLWRDGHLANTVPLVTAALTCASVGGLVGNAMKG